MNRYHGGKTRGSRIYLSLGTFKKIALLTALTLFLDPNLGYSSVIEVGPTISLSEGNAILKNFTMEFSNKTNATLENYVTSSDKGDAIIQAINIILRGEDYEPVEPLAEEELEEEELEEESSSSSSSDSDSDTSGEFQPQPGDEQTFPEDAEPQPFPEPNPEPEPDPNNGSEDNSNDNNDSNGDNISDEAEDSTE